MKALAVLVLRFKMPGAREWKVPLNFHIGKTEIPVGLALIALALLSLAIINVLTKKVATISGLSFTIAFFITFELSEKYNKRRASAKQDELEKFRLDAADDLSSESVKARPGNVLVAVRNPNSLEHLKKTLEKTDTRRIDIVVLAVRTVTQAGSGEHSLEAEQLFTSSETELFSKVVYLAEKAGKHVELVVVPGVDPNLVGVQTAQKLQSARIVAGVSAKMNPAEQGRRVGEAWEKLPQPRPTLSLEIIAPTGQSTYFNLGPHPPQLWPEDIELVHNLWLEMDEAAKGAKLRHRDVIGVALRLLEAKLHSPEQQEVIQAALKEAEGPHGGAG
jgi:hypothetical protein